MGWLRFTKPSGTTGRFPPPATAMEICRRVGCRPTVSSRTPVPAVSAAEPVWSSRLRTVIPWAAPSVAGVQPGWGGRPLGRDLSPGLPLSEQPRDSALQQQCGQPGPHGCQRRRVGRPLRCDLLARLPLPGRPRARAGTGLCHHCRLSAESGLPVVSSLGERQGFKDSLLVLQFLTERVGKCTK